MKQQQPASNLHPWQASRPHPSSARTRQVFFSILAAILISITLFNLRGPAPQRALAAPETEVGLYEVFETQVTNDNSYTNPFDFTEIELQATFTAPSGRQVPFFGFYDGNGSGGQDGQVWKLRFMPDETGLWSYSYAFSDGSGSGSGNFTVVDTGRPGPLRVASDNPRYFMTARGEPFHWRGYDLRYLSMDQDHLAYRGSAAQNYIAILENYALADGYNFVMIQTPSALENPDSGSDFGSWWYQGELDRFDVKVWNNFESIVQYAQQHNIYLVTFDNAVAQPNAEYLTPALMRYMAARLGVYASFLGYSPTWEYYDVFSEQQVDEIMGQFNSWLPENTRPLLTVHDQARSRFRDWQSFHMRQGGNDQVVSDLGQANNRSLDVESSLRPYNLPIIGSEDIWEAPGAANERFGYPKTGDEVRHTAWAEMMAGVMPLYSEWSWFLSIGAPNRLGNGEGEPFVRRMFDFFYTQTNYRQHQQLNNLVSTSREQFASGIPEQEYLVYDANGGSLNLDLSAAGGKTFSVLWFNPVNGERQDGGTVEGGAQRSLSSPYADEWVLLLEAGTAPPPPPGIILEGSLQINFQPNGMTTPDGFLADEGAIFGDRGNGQTYGWNNDNSQNARQRNSANSPNSVYDSFNHTQQNGDFTWEIALPNGDYLVRVLCGDPDYTNSNFRILAEGAPVVNGVPQSQERWLAGAAVVTVSDGRLTVNNASGASNNKINMITITPYEQPPYSAFLPLISEQ